MSNRTAAFGTGQGAEGVAPPPQISPDTMIEDIHRIAEKYDSAPLLQPRTFLLATGYAAKSFNFMQAKVNALVLTVTNGLIYGYFADNSSGTGQLPAAPHFVCSAGVVPTTIQIAVPQGEDYIITLQEGANGTNAAGCLTAMCL